MTWQGYPRRVNVLKRKPQHPSLSGLPGVWSSPSTGTWPPFWLRWISSNKHWCPHCLQALPVTENTQWYNKKYIQERELHHSVKFTLVFKLDLLLFSKNVYYLNRWLQISLFINPLWHLQMNLHSAWLLFQKKENMSWQNNSKVSYDCANV